MNTPVNDFLDALRNENVETASERLARENAESLERQQATRKRRKERAERRRDNTGLRPIIDNAVDKAARRIQQQVFALIPPQDDADHPWKVTPNGGNTVSVSAGEMLSFQHETVSAPSPTATNLSSYFNLDNFASYSGGDVTVTGSGFIYAQVGFANGGPYVWDSYTNIDGVEVQVNLDSIRPSGVVTVAFGTSLPTSGDVFVVKLAEVALSGGVAQVNKQIITHNPTLFTQSITGQDVTP